MMPPKKGFTVWFTGLPSAGKSTLAELLAVKLRERGQDVEVLDGDVVRQHLCKGLGFSKEDRDENIRRIGFVCGLLTRHGAAAIAAAISPYRAIRDEVRGSIGNFIEVYVKASVETCIQRDVKGLYKKALAGEIKGFTGVDDPYEPPLKPELTIETEMESPQESVARILRGLEELGYAEPLSESAYTPEEEARIRERLVRLGYLEP
jgi:adenylyl-sulfate kinase